MILSFRKLFHSQKTTTRLISLVILILFSFSGFGQQWQWANTFEATSVNVTSSDTYGEFVYCTGTFSGNLTVDGEFYMNEGDDDAFLAKFTLNGDLQWIEFLSGGGLAPGFGYDGLNCVRVDAEGNVVVTGQHAAGSDIADQTLNSDGSFIAAKFNSDGLLQWVAQSSLAGGAGVDITIDSNNDIYVCGFHGKTVAGGGTSVYGGVALGYFGGTDGFLLKISSSGIFLWGQRIGGSQNDNANAVQVVNDTSVVLVGSAFSAGVTFGTTNIVQWPHGKSFVVEYDAATGLYKQSYFTDLTSGSNTLRDIMNEPSDERIYVLGDFGGSLGYPEAGHASTTTPDNDIFILVLNSNLTGDTIYQFGVTGSSCQERADEFDMRNGVFYIAGRTNCSGNIQGFPLTAGSGITNGLMLEVNVGGTLMGLHELDAQDFVEYNAIAKGTDGVFVGGKHGADPDFSPLQLTALNNNTGFFGYLQEGMVTEVDMLAEQPNQAVAYQNGLFYVNSSYTRIHDMLGRVLFETHDPVFRIEGATGILIFETQKENDIQRDKIYIP